MRENNLHEINLHTACGLQGKGIVLHATHTIKCMEMRQGYSARFSLWVCLLTAGTTRGMDALNSPDLQ